MNKRIIPILSVVMTISFIVSVILQLYFFRQVLQKSNEDFSSRVTNALLQTSDRIQDEELRNFYNLFGNFYSDAVKNKNVSTRQVINSIVDSGDYRYISYQNYIIEKKDIPIPLSKGDTLKSTKLYTDEGTLKIQRQPNDLEQTEKLTKQMENSLDNAQFSIKNFARLNFNQTPINQRINTLKIKKVLKEELEKRHITTDFDVAVLNKDSKLTDIKDNEYKNISGKTYNTTLFSNQDDKPEYYLSIYFPNKNASVLKPYLLPIFSTLLSSLIIISIYILSIYFINKQKQISDIKTDFINNMTHEFKTPIATINIASDAIKNKNVINDPEKITYYSNLIKNENKRMNKQVEMVLRMTKLERNELEFNLKPLPVEPIIEDAISSIKIMVENRNGTIIEDLNTKDVQVQADEFHLTNSLVNLLDNANKYSPENPKILVRSYVKDDYVYIEIQDEGMGMKKTNLSKIFDKFFREETGNVHNVKGHGLGLAYVKKIVEQHKGEIEVESKENVGSTFRIKLPIIK